MKPEVKVNLYIEDDQEPKINNENNVQNSQQPQFKPTRDPKIGKFLDLWLSFSLNLAKIRLSARLLQQLLANKIFKTIFLNYSFSW